MKWLWVFILILLISDTDSFLFGRRRRRRSPPPPPPPPPPDPDDCASNPCLNGACRDHVGSYSCSCNPGYAGSRCQTDVNECSSNPCRYGTCTDAVNRYSCRCNAGYRGTTCETNINECESSPCLNRGTCIDGIASYTCRCRAGYRGSRCMTNINECASNPCLHGTCTDHINRFSCACDPGYSGQTCSNDINECGSNPCVHGGCVDEVHAYSCMCESGYEGAQCHTESDECISSPCIFGDCSDSLDAFQCSCDGGYIGDTCEEVLCMNGGTYNHETNRCLCTQDYQGARCQELIIELHEASQSYGPVSGGTKISFTGKNLLELETPRVYYNYHDTNYGQHAMADGTIDAYNDTMHSSNSSSHGDLCAYINGTETTLQCFTSPLNSTSLVNKPLPLTLVWPSHVRVLDIEVNFTYKVNPVVSEMYPLESIIGGGTNITVIGQNFGSVIHPTLMTTVTPFNDAEKKSGGKNHVFYDRCNKISGAKLRCPTPNITSVLKQHQDIDKKQEIGSDGFVVYLGLLFDGLETYRNLSDSPVAEYGKLVYRQDPTVTTVAQTHTVKTWWPNKPGYINIEGDFSGSVNIQEQLQVYVGDVMCKTFRVFDTGLEFVPPATQDTPGQTEHLIQVHLGNFHSSPGSVTYETSITQCTWCMCTLLGCLGVVLVVPCGVCIYCKARRAISRMKTWKTRVEMRLHQRLQATHKRETTPNPYVETKEIQDAREKKTGVEKRSGSKHTKRDALSTYIEPMGETADDEQQQVYENINPINHRIRKQKDGVQETEIQSGDARNKQQEKRCEDGSNSEDKCLPLYGNITINGKVVDDKGHSEDLAEDEQMELYVNSRALVTECESGSSRNHDQSKKELAVRRRNLNGGQMNKGKHNEHKTDREVDLEEEEEDLQLYVNARQDAYETNDGTGTGNRNDQAEEEERSSDEDQLYENSEACKQWVLNYTGHNCDEGEDGDDVLYVNQAFDSRCADQEPEQQHARYNINKRRTLMPPKAV